MDKKLIALLVIISLIFVIFVSTVNVNVTNSTTKNISDDVVSAVLEQNVVQSYTVPVIDSENSSITKDLAKIHIALYINEHNHRSS
ncbi:MAG: hypothetical protein MJ203_01090 [archaeon]|nr:hypothetical protein [archaeon]